MRECWRESASALVDRGLLLRDVTEVPRDWQSRSATEMIAPPDLATGAMVATVGCLPYRERWSLPARARSGSTKLVVQERGALKSRPVRADELLMWSVVRSRRLDRRSSKRRDPWPPPDQSGRIPDDCRREVRLPVLAAGANPLADSVRSRAQRAQAEPQIPNRQRCGCRPGSWRTCSSRDPDPRVVFVATSRELFASIRGASSPRLSTESRCRGGFRPLRGAPGESSSGVSGQNERE